MGLNSSTENTIAALNNLPFEDIIGGPLNACIKAQAEAAISTVNFIQSVGMTTDSEGKTQAIYVVFSYIQNGRRVNISVPLLTIVPIPYIAISDISIDFKAAISAVETTNDEDQDSIETAEEREASVKKGGGWLTKKRTAKMKSSISTKRDSKSTRESSYSIEATLDVSVRAGAESIPAGLSKVLELLTGSVDIVPTNGDITYEGPFYTADGKPAINVNYKNPQGLLDPVTVKVSSGTTTPDLTTGKCLVVFSNTSTMDVTVYISDNDAIKRTISIPPIAQRQ